MNQRKKRRKRHDTLVLQLLIIVALVLIVFEGRLIYTMITFRSSDESTVTTTQNKTDQTQNETDTIQKSSSVSSGSASHDSVLAGFPGIDNSSASAEPVQETEPTHPTVSNPDSAAIVAKTEKAVDDSYFSDAVFIGDSRMEGFRNASGITQGTFFTSVGMSLSSMANDPVISTADGNITVAAALSGGKYNKIYIMLGANDLGEYDWNSFRDGFIAVTKRFKEIQPDALIYICSVIYVEEAKVTSGSYVNNTNVDKINSILLQICEDQDYHYLNLNEFLSNGYGSLVEGASSDGVHIYEKYCKQMLDYLKCHYIDDTSASAESADETESETETDVSSDSV